MGGEHAECGDLVVASHEGTMTGTIRAETGFVDVAGVPHYYEVPGVDV
jgi:hypothetical protein